jgi:triosephosphate isomerase
MRIPLVAGNWKMNGSLAQNATLIQELKSGLENIAGAEVVICPPYVYLQQMIQAVQGSLIKLGAQNLSTEEKGAYTGEVSGAMLVDLGCTYVIVGHSERRHLYGETDDVVAQKFARAQQFGLVPILCVGETLVEREMNSTQVVVARQLDVIIQHLGVECLNKAVIAYEPVWAIGTGRTASPEQAQAVHEFIRGRIADLDADVAAQVRVLYGGSVNADNAAALFANTDIDGGLIGGASLQASSFLMICRSGAQSAGQA